MRASVVKWEQRRTALMARARMKTEHSGAKHANGAYYGFKKDAKRVSAKVRRFRERREIRQEQATRTGRS